jgi:hypothetical protein
LENTCEIHGKETNPALYMPIQPASVLLKSKPNSLFAATLHPEQSEIGQLYLVVFRVGRWNHFNNVSLRKCQLVIILRKKNRRKQVE